MIEHYTILTDKGASKTAEAFRIGQKIEITQIALGDGNGRLPQPQSNVTSLVNERYRAPINSAKVDENNSSWVVFEQVLTPDVGGWWIREVGLYDKDGDLIAVGNYPEQYKPLLTEGASTTQTVSIVIQVISSEAITLKVDPSIVLATRQYVDDASGIITSSFEQKTKEIDQTVSSISLNLGSASNRNAIGEGDLISENFLKDHSYFSMDHKEIISPATDYVIREVSDTGFNVNDAGVYFINGCARVWANNGGGSGSAGSWGAAITVNGTSVSMQVANRNNPSSPDNRDGTVPLSAIVRVNKGDRIASGFYYGGGTPWDKAIYLSTLCAFKLGN